jgi:hypothetical protein
MNGFKIPLDFSQDNFYIANSITSDKDYEEENADKFLKISIGAFIKLLVGSPYGSYKPDARFGFSLENCHFQNPNSKDEIQGKKIGGKSDNINNYAKDLEQSIKLFEPRLKNVEVKTEYDKKNAKITIEVSGIVIETKKEYNQNIEFFIWNKNENI